MASRWVLAFVSRLIHPAPLVAPLLAKNIDTGGPWCASACLTLRYENMSICKISQLDLSEQESC